MPRLVRSALERSKIGGLGRVATGVDVIGDIAVVRLVGLEAGEKRRFGEALLSQLPHVKGVFEQEGAIEGDFRLRPLRHVAGERRTLTVHRENGCLYKVDVARCYFSPRLSTERLRVAGEVRAGERVLNMFAGVGPFSIPVAKLAGARVLSCEINDYAARLHEENDRLNKVDRLVEVVNGDASRLPEKTKAKFDRILMPHPSQADKFLGVALSLAAKRATIHYYRHVLGRDEGEASASLKDELAGILPPKSAFKIRKVREVGARWLEMAADVKLPG
jgi:tRNA (guanine37-N1)-methyltransferase